MKDADKQEYLKKYKEKKANGELFFPHSIAKDAIVSLGIFVLLIALAIFVGVPNEPPANPSDSSYIPRPEWYFLWMFQLLKYFPGKLEGIAIVGLGLLIAVGLFGLPFFDRSPKRHPLNRPIATIAMLLIVAGMVFLTIQAVVTTPAAAEGVNVGGDQAARIEAGGKLYADNCAKCHGEDGEGAELPDQPGEFTNPLNDEPFLITHTSDSLFNVIDYGWETLGMPPFGLRNGGALTDPEMRAIVEFIQAWYTPPEAESSGTEQVVDPATIETVSFAQHIKPILDKRCLSCHGTRTKGGYSVKTYEQVMTSGDNAPVIVAGDAANSILAQMLRGVETPAGGQMPPSRPLAQQQIELIEKWINQGAQNN